jgi:hypothetical protein
MENIKEHKVIFNQNVFVRIITENTKQDLSYNDPIAKLAVYPTRSTLKNGVRQNNQNSDFLDLIANHFS